MTTLKAVLDGAVPEALKEFYTEKEGKYFLNAEGLTPETELKEAKAKISEFRDSNVRLMKRIDEELLPKLKTFDGLDPEEYKTLKAEKETFTKKGVKGADDIEALIQKNVSAAVKPLVDELTNIKQERLTLKQQLESKAVDEHITNVANKAGIDPDCLRPALTLAREVFKYKDGKVIALNGDTPVYSKEHPDQPLTAEEWLPTGVPKAFFKPSAGGGADGGDTHKSGGARIIKMPDAVTFGKNLEDIASGKAVVEP
jgi:uncharacterized protein YdcH (DUF465 family)